MRSRTARKDGFALDKSPMHEKQSRHQLYQDTMECKKMGGKHVIIARGKDRHSFQIEQIVRCKEESVEEHLQIQLAIPPDPVRLPRLAIKARFKEAR